MLRGESEFFGHYLGGNPKYLTENIGGMRKKIAKKIEKDPLPPCRK